MYKPDDKKNREKRIHNIAPSTNTLHNSLTKAHMAH